VLAVRAEAAAAPAVSMFERALVLAVCDALLGTPWATVRDQIVAALAAPEFGSARRRAFIGQIVAEAAGAFGDVDTALAMLALAVRTGCSIATGSSAARTSRRCAPTPYPALHAEVVARAEAVQDALFGEHRGRGTADTLPNTTAG
jgi:hypothetical protein